MRAYASRSSPTGRERGASRRTMPSCSPGSRCPRPSCSRSERSSGSHQPGCTGPQPSSAQGNTLAVSIRSNFEKSDAFRKIKTDTGASSHAVEPETQPPSEVHPPQAHHASLSSQLPQLTHDGDAGLASGDTTTAMHAWVGLLQALPRTRPGTSGGYGATHHTLGLQKP